MREGRTFAERKAAKEVETTGRRLVSLGPTEHVQRNKRGELELVPVELFVDWDKRTEFYVRMPGHPQLIALHEDTRRDDVTPLPPLPDGQRRISKPDTGRTPTPGDPPPVAVASENPLYTPNP